MLVVYNFVTIILEAELSMNKNAIIACLIFIMSTNFVQAFDLDMTVDDEIRKNYNSSKLVDDTHTGS